MEDTEESRADQRIANLTKSLREVRRERDQLQTQLDERAGQDAQFEDLKQRNAALQQEFDEFKAQAGQKIALANAGIVDPEDQDLLLYMHGKRTDDMSLEDYLAGPARESKRLSSMFSTAEQTEAAGSEQAAGSESGESEEAATSGNAAAANATGRNAQGASGSVQFTADQINNMSDEEYEKNYPLIQAQMQSGQL